MEITESRPTTDQLSIIRNLKSLPKEFENSSKDDIESSVGEKVPILVDWDNGKVAVNDFNSAKAILENKANE